MLMLRGLVSLGPVREVRPELLQPEVIPQMPLWGNPLLQLELRQDQRTVKWQLDDQDPTTLHVQLQARRQEQLCGFEYRVGTPGLFTLADLCTLLFILRGLRSSLMRVRRRAFPAQGPLAQVCGVDVAGFCRLWWLACSAPGSLVTYSLSTSCRPVWGPCLQRCPRRDRMLPSSGMPSRARGSATCPPPSAAWTALPQKARSGLWWGAWAGMGWSLRQLVGKWANKLTGSQRRAGGRCTC